MKLPRKTHVPPVLPSAFGKNLKRFPLRPKTRVYFLCHRGEIVYVGRTRQLARRSVWHSSRKLFDSVFYLNVLPSDVSRVERELIANFRPKYNAPVDGALDENGNLGPPVRLCRTFEYCPDD